MISIGQHYGFLVVEGTDATGKRITTRCRCGRKVIAAADDLAAGLITSCGCKPPKRAFRAEQAKMMALRNSEAEFSDTRSHGRGYRRPDWRKS